MKDRSSLFNAILSIIMGILFCIYRGGVIGIATTIIGVLILIIGVLSLISADVIGGLIYIVLGIVIIVFGWAIAKIAIYVLAVILIVIGIMQLVGYSKQNIKGTNTGMTILIYAIPIIDIVIGVLLFINLGGTVDWIFYVTGVLLIIDGIIGLFGYALNSKN